MEFTLGPLIGIALATMFFGYFFGLVEGRGQGYRRRKKEEPLERQAVIAAAKPAVEPAPSTTAAQPVLDNAWLQLYTDHEGRPSLDLDGVQVDTSHLTVEQHQRLVQLMVVMRPWVEGTVHAGPTASGPGALEAAGRSTAGSGGVPVPTSAPTPADPAAPTSMVAQIDVILQARLQGTPLASRGIRLAESRDGGVLVFVGHESYPGISDVPDPEVQAAIHAAISDWEKRYTPG